jgi:hypothetical protein
MGGPKGHPAIVRAITVVDSAGLKKRNPDAVLYSVRCV